MRGLSLLDQRCGRYRALAAIQDECPKVVFATPDGGVWTAREIPGFTIPGAHGARCLVFDGPHAMRRVWSYPPDWASLSSAELLELSWRN